MVNVINQILRNIERKDESPTEDCLPVSMERYCTVANQLQEILAGLEIVEKTDKSQGSDIAIIRQIGKNSYIKEYGDGRKEKIVFSKDSKIHDFYES